MAEEGVEKQEATAVEGAIGKLEPDPDNPEIMTGKVIWEIETFITPDGNVFIDRKPALKNAQSLRETGTKV